MGRTVHTLLREYAVMNGIHSLDSVEFDQFLAAVKLLADAAVNGVDFDDFALHFEQAEDNPLYDERETTFIFNVTDALQNGLDQILVQMQIGVELGGSLKACLDGHSELCHSAAEDNQ